MQNRNRRAAPSCAAHRAGPVPAATRCCVACCAVCCLSFVHAGEAVVTDGLPQGTWGRHVHACKCRGGNTMVGMRLFAGLLLTALRLWQTRHGDVKMYGRWCGSLAYRGTERRPKIDARLTRGAPRLQSGVSALQRRWHAVPLSHAGRHDCSYVRPCIAIMPGMCN